MSKNTSASKEKLFIAFILLLALILRLATITKHDFWFDEAFTYQIAKLPIRNLLLASLLDNHPPLYYLVIHLMIKINKNEIFLRLPSLIASVATAIFVFSIAKSQFTKKIAYLSAMLFAVSPLTVYMATEARPHSIAIFLSALMIFLFLKYMKEKSTATLLAFIFISIISLYTQYYIGLLFIPFTYLIYMQSKKNFNKWFLATIICLGALAPWLVFNLISKHNPCYCPNSLISLPQTLIWPAVAAFDSNNIRSYLNLSPPILIVLVTTSTISLFAFFKGLINKNLIAKIYILPLLLVSILGIFANVFSPKAFSIFSPLFIILIAYGANQTNKKYLPILLFLFFSTVSLLRITHPFFRSENLKDVYKYLDSRPSSPIYHTSLLTYYSADFYLKKTTENQMITTNPLKIETTQYIGGNKEDLKSLPQTFWLVDTDKWTPRQERDTALNFINSNYQKYESTTIPPITITKYILR